MATITRGSGVRIDAPAGVRVSDARRSRAARGARAASAFTAAPLPLLAPQAAAQADLLVGAFQGQDMQLADALLLEPPRSSPSATARSRAGGPATAPVTDVTLSVDVDPTESAAVLLEQDGYFSWQLPQTPPAPAPGVRGRSRAAARNRLEFRIVLDSPPAAPPPVQPTGRRTRGLRDVLEQTALGQARAFVFRFAARVVVGSAMAVLERDVRTGLVNMTAEDPSNWSAVDDPTTVSLPTNRQPRILLFLHGTFSSTIGSFGALGGSPWGRKLLEASRQTYDVVLGFDHPTLSVDPIANAAALLTILQRLPTTQPPRIDVIGYSRGGLVFRSLVEHLLPHSAWRPTVGRAIFVAVPNAGTTLAGSKQWPLLIDLYTNLAVAACRALGWIPQAAAVAPILSESVKSLGALVKYVVSGVAEEDGVPGLAAMNPKGVFITALNGSQADQPTVADTWYAAITSQFEPPQDINLAPAELPRRLLQRIVDAHVDFLFGAPNDLVVDTASMTAIDVPVDAFIKQRYDFGKTTQVYHTRYFIQPAVASALVRWLELPDPVVAALGRAQRGRRAALGPALAQVPAQVDVDVARARVDDTPAAVRAMVERETPSYVVVERTPEMHYAFKPEELLQSLRGARAGASLGDVLDLHEGDASPEVSGAFEEFARIARESIQLTYGGVGGGQRATRGRGIVRIGQGTLGVVQGGGDEGDVRALRGMATAAAAPHSTGDAVIARRVLPTFELPGSPILAGGGRRTARDRSRVSPPSAVEREPPRAVRTVTSNVRGECEAEMVLDVPAAVEVTVSRETLGATRGRVSSQAAVALDPNQRMVVQLAPRTPFDVLGPTFLVFDPPAPGAPFSGYFTVKPRVLGEAELWLLVSQAQTQLALLKLKPNVVERRAEAKS